MKIATVTLNPAIDRSILYDGDFKAGVLNRAKNAVVNAGGKGINVSRMMKRLGEDTTVYGFAGGRCGRMLTELLAEENIECDFTGTAAETRMNIKIIDGNGVETEINEAGGPVKKSEFDRLIDKLNSSSADVVIIGGSTPAGLETDTVRKIVSSLKLRGKTVITDVSGEPLCQAVESRPYLIKPNREEFCQLLGYRPQGDEIIDKAKEFYGNTGIEMILTLGKEGAFYAGRGGCYRVINPHIRPKGFSGAGDTFLASYVYCVCRGDDIRDSLRFASAASLSKVSLEGTALPDVEHIKSNLDKIQVIDI